ncbi:gliding motility protein GldM [Lacibacter sp.]|uniref:type IX secretion system motor protein PorM/GldM n=1 Tax=Lacibacter sp. TaxID=1915409 RepID=UPI002B4B0EA1|nr:gliding motility protein GldM [Lacibacter sp.]HLP39522.1 gliding motility protein GldM [Lacibacter sp.]
MALPKEPRQKMINLMYLVLTALLALNVSAEIINAFKVVDNSLTTTNTVVNRSTETIMESFKIKLESPESKVKAAEWMPKAQEAVRLTKEVSDYIDQLKMKIKVEAGYDPKDPESKFKEDNVDIATRIMDKQGEGEKLRNKLIEYKKKMLAIDGEVGKMFEKNIPVDTEIPKASGPKLAKRTWAYAYFHMTPTVAALTMLSKFQNDVKTTESRFVNEFHNRVGQVVVRFDAFEPIVGSNTTYLFPGQEMEITAGLAAFSKSKLPTVSIAGAPVELNEKGMAVRKYKVGSTSGSVKVVVNYTDQDGNPAKKEVDLNYTVGTATGAFVSAEKVKVLYIGLDNELAVSGGNVGDEKVTVGINNGSLSKIGPGRYIAKPTTPGKAVVTVNSDGKPSSFEFRVKTVPDPTPMVGASKGGRIPANVFKAQRGIRAELENFVFEGVSFTVTGYTFYATGNGFPDAGVKPGIRGNTFDAVQDLMNRCKPGTTVVLDEIKAVGPGGNTRPLPPISFVLY